ncbi:MAG: type II secretion system protein [Verrucomicrobiota bacterium]
MNNFSDRIQVRKRSGEKGMTLLELMTVVIIISILAVMLMPIYSSVTASADEARCVANLKNLYVAASGYLQAAGSWPQVQVSLLTSDPKTYARSWVDALTPFGAPHKVWICPALQRTMGYSIDAIDKDENYRIDFIATPFDENPVSPMRSSGHPWFLEKSAQHPRGNLIVLSNGSVTSMKDLVGE